MLVNCGRNCRHLVVARRCVADCLWRLASCLVNTRLKRACLLALAIFSALWWSNGRDIKKVGKYRQWNSQSLGRPPTTTRYFVHARNVDIFMYSAIANSHIPVSGAINIIITTLDTSRTTLDCCILLDNSTLFTTPAQEYFFYHVIDLTFVAKIVELFFYPRVHKAHQYSCSVPDIGLHARHVTLTTSSSSSSCSSDIRDYLPIHYPSNVPGGLAVCSKIAHSGGLDPEKVIEWFEVQRILGVDKVLIFNMDNSDGLNRVFRYYQQIGLLDLQPYELPGEPANRTLMEKEKHSQQFHHDESMAVLECRQRMSGYTYVMSHDLDEFIIPRKDVSLKQFFTEKMKEYQDSAGFFFDVEFFIYNWGPSHPDEDLTLTRYRKATRPHWECTKYVFLPSRTLSITTHDIFPLSPYTTYKIEASDAVIHHYRRCPDDTWSTCFPETITDHTMTRYHNLHAQVMKVRDKTNTKPAWSFVPGPDHM